MRVIMACSFVLYLVWGGTVLPTGEIPSERRDLAGLWSFRLDPEDVGVREKWFRGKLQESLKLPGSLQKQGFGYDVTLETPWTGKVSRSFYTSKEFEKYRQPGNIKFPFLLQPEKHYVGSAWYQRVVQIPSSWEGKRFELILERPHWETRVWINEMEIGSNNSLSVAHLYELPDGLKAGDHLLTVRVDNRMVIGVGPNSHSITDHTQSNWNGIVGKLELQATPKIWIDDLQTRPDPADRKIRAVVRIGNRTGSAGKGKLRLVSGVNSIDAPVEWGVDGGVADVVLSLGADAPLWDEHRPVLHTLTATVESASGSHSLETTFGLREIHVEGTQFVLNGKRIFLRGTLECCIFPLTGYPNMDVASWKHIISRCKAHGLNHMRFHSWCPPEAAFVAADELGFYFQVEASSWCNQGCSLGDGKPFDKWLYEETDRILKAYGNHPSFLLMAYGNEPGGKNKSQYLGRWVNHYRKEDDRRVYTSGAGWPSIPENDFHNTARRIRLRPRINARPPETSFDYRDEVVKSGIPLVSHEIGQWCVYPDFDEIKKYTGVLKAKNFEVFRDFLNENHMGDQARDFLMASGKLQALCYKEDIESALRTPGFGGFQLLDLHDFPGHGTALVGVLDPFWDSKPYIDPETFRRFCNDTVPLARMERRYWKRSETFRAAIEVCHFGAKDINKPIDWKLVKIPDGLTVASGTLEKALPAGALTQVGTVETKLPEGEKADHLRLVIGIRGTLFENDWDFWVFPDDVSPAGTENILVTHNLKEAERRLLEGGSVLLLAPSRMVKSEVAIGFSSVFWNTFYTDGRQAPHTLGILCDPGHSVFDNFPTEEWSDWQWWELVTGSATMVMDEFPADFRPLVQSIDTWFKARRLGLLFEAEVCGGKLMVCSMDLSTDLEKRVVARQMRRSILDYMEGNGFAPSRKLDLGLVEGLFTPH